jgi:DHA1 family bicyclomycin/chloramphenicol resistance-like MFS transporter
MTTPPGPPPTVRPNTVLLATVVSMMVAFGPMTIDLYLPALPAIAVDLGASADQVQRTLSVYIVGFAFSQLVYGPLSDRFGRRPMLFAGVGLYIAASVACALAQSVDQLVVFRFLQAVGASCGPVLGRAVVRDYYTREEAARVMSWVISVMSLAPILAPVFGGLIATWADWRMNFWVLALFGASVILAVALFLGESNRFKDPTATDFGAMAKNFGTMLRHRIYVGFLLTNVCMFGGLFSWLNGSSFVLIERMGMSPMEYGLAFGVASVGFLSGAQTAARLVRRWGIERMCILGAACAAVGGGVIFVLLWAGADTPLAVMVPTVAYFFGMGITVPNIQAGAVSPFPRNAGAASSLIGLFQYASAGVVTLALGHFGFDPTLLMATMMGVAGLLAILVFNFLVWQPTKRMSEAERNAER